MVPNRHRDACKSAVCCMGTWQGRTRAFLLVNSGHHRHDGGRYWKTTADAAAASSAEQFSPPPAPEWEAEPPSSADPTICDTTGMFSDPSAARMRQWLQHCMFHG